MHLLYHQTDTLPHSLVDDMSYSVQSVYIHNTDFERAADVASNEKDTVCHNLELEF